jgi:Domain of unknown function (DUF4352)
VVDLAAIGVRSVVLVLVYGFAGFIGLIVLWGILEKLHFPPAVRVAEARKRSIARKRAAVAEGLGMRYDADDPNDLVSLPLSMLSWGRQRWVKHVYSGTWRGRDAYEFGFFYQVPGGRYGPQTLSRRAAVVRIDAGLPHVIVERRALGQAHDPIQGADPVPFPDDAEFDHEYRVLSSDPAFAAEAIDANVRRWMLDLKQHWRFELSGEWILAVPETGSRALGERGILEVASDLADRVPWILTQQWAAGELEPDPLPAGPPPLTAKQRRSQRRWNRAIWAFVIAVFGLLAVRIVVGVLTQHHSPRGTAPPPVPGDTAGPSPAAAGATLVLDGVRDDERVEVTVLRILDPAHASGFLGASKGKRLVGVELRLHNVGQSTYEDAPSNGARLVTEDGVEVDASLFDEVHPALGSVGVAPGDTATGFVTFEVPKHRRATEFRFALDSGFGGPPGVWAIGS